MKNGSRRHTGVKGSAGRGFLPAALLVLFVLGISGAALAVGPVRVTDVTPRSFAAAWGTVVPSPVVELRKGDCSTPAGGYTADSKSSTAAGVTAVRFANLSSATTYCLVLDGSPAANVVTASSIVRTVPSGSGFVLTGNDIVRAPDPYLAPGETRDAVVATLEMADGSGLSPIARFLSADPSRDYFNLNNLFSAATGATLDLVGGERVKITESHGATGCVVERFRTVSPDGGRTVPRSLVRGDPADIDASGGVNILDILRVVAGKGSGSSGSCFNSDLDLNGDSVVDILDLQAAKTAFGSMGGTSALP